MELGRRQRRALDAVAETFHPGAVARGVPAAFLELLVPRLPPGEQERLRRLLSLLAAQGIARLAPDRRERTLLAWADSRLGFRRTGFLALKKGLLLLAYTLPGAPLAELGYPGPPRHTGPASGPELHPLAVVGEGLALECDVCVVGSGAGGATAAAVLAGSGLDVVVLEAGGYYGPADLGAAELDSYRRLYLDGITTATVDHGVGIVAGACVGGGTVVNYTTSFALPEGVREEWAAHGVPAFASGEYAASERAVCERLGVNTRHNRPSSRDERLRAGAERLGWRVGEMPRNVEGCDQGRVCGFCGHGCRLGAKRSAAATWLADAEAAGARIVAGAHADRIVVERGAARRVEATAAGGRRVTVTARAVVAACGALRTPTLLLRSGLANPAVGRHLRLHPTPVALGFFDEEVRPWEGAMQALYSDELRDLDCGYGVTYETAPVHPGLLAAGAPWRGAAAHAALVGSLRHAVGIGALLRDRGAGEVRVGRDGHASYRYRLSEHDVRHARAGLEGAAAILEAAGARRIVSTHLRGVAYEPGGAGGRAAFLRAADAAGWREGRLPLFSFHQMGSARMGGSPRGSACDPEGVVWEAPNLVVCDASAFPTASGVNPMVAVAAVAHLNASALAARLR